MLENLSSTNINFYNYISSQEKLLKTQNNNSQLNIFKKSLPCNLKKIKQNKNILISNRKLNNIKVNNIRLDVLNQSDQNFAKTNRDFYYYNNSLNKRNSIPNLKLEYFKTITTNKIDNNIGNEFLSSYRSKKGKNVIYINKDDNNNLYNLSLNNYSKNKFNMNNNLKYLLTEKRKPANYSKGIFNFKNIKMFYAHMELLISLYLKRNYKFFIEQIKKYQKIIFLENNINLYNSINNHNLPIINLNNTHCSLYYSININKDNDNIFNTLNMNKDKINNSQKKEQNFIINTDNNINLNNKKGHNNNLVYVPKNKTNKLNQYKQNNEIINSYNARKSSPIKEMNIDLKKMNSNKNRLNKMNFNNNFNKENKGMKLSNSKDNIYKRPKDNNNLSKNVIKEIKISKKEIISTPYECKTKNFFKNISSIKQFNKYNKENNNIKKIYIRKNNNNNENIKENIKTSLFRNSSDLSNIKSLTDFLKTKPKEILIKKIFTSDKRIFININYVYLDSISKNKIKNKNFFGLKFQHILSLTIIKNILLMPEYFNKKANFSDIFIFDNDKRIFSFNKNNKIGQIKHKKNISLINYIKIIKEIILKSIRRYILNIFKKNIFLKRILDNNNKKIIKYYFKRYCANKNINIKKSEIYHKINYNDDFNMNKKIELIQKGNNKETNKYPNYYYSKQNNSIKYRNKKKKIQIESSNNTARYHTFWNKEINITVHANKDNDIKKKNINQYNKKK